MNMMHSTVNLRMFMVGILIEQPNYSMYFIEIYDKFMKVFFVDFFRHIPKFYSPQRVFHDLVRNDDNWFILFPSKMIHPGETDDHCFVQLNQDISILENIRTRFTQSQLSTRYTAGPSLRTFLDVTLNSLQHKISLLRLPPVNDTFGFLFANGVRSVASTSSRPQSSEFSPTFTQL